MSYNWLTFGGAKSELGIRLNSSLSDFWTNAEAGQYIALAMQMWNAHTAFWISEYAMTLTPPFAGNWFQANGAGSPRQPQLTDIDLYTLLEYMLIEPPSGGTWTGTPQFSMTALAQAVQGRRDEALQIGATNVSEIALNIVPNTDRVTLPDNVLDVVRCRYVPTSGSAATLQRGDAESFRVFTPSYLQTRADPARYDLISGPPLALTVDTNVPVPNTIQALAVQAQPVPSPPAATPLGIPDDWAWVPLFGALYDLLIAQEEALDEPRSKYCLMRYKEGLEMLTSAPWILEGRINNVPVDTASFAAADRFNYNWQANAAAFPQIVVGATDLYAIAPVPAIAVSALLVVVGNAPIPTADAQPIQVPRDVMDAILDEAEHLAQFKRGGSSFLDSIELHKSFLETADHWKRRIRSEGIYPTMLRRKSPREAGQQPRFALQKE